MVSVVYLFQLPRLQNRLVPGGLPQQKVPASLSKTYRAEQIAQRPKRPCIMNVVEIKPFYKRCEAGKFQKEN